MGTIRDLRDLINVSRLTYRESDSEPEFEDLEDGDKSGERVAPVNLVRKYNGPNGCGRQKLTNLMITPVRPNKYSAKEAVLKDFKTAKVPIKPTASFVDSSVESSLTSFKNKKFSQLAPIPVKLSNESSSSRDLPILSKSSMDEESRRSSSRTKSSAKSRNDKDDNDDEGRMVCSSSKDMSVSSKDATACGNYDGVLMYIDAAVVTEWLNRANRYLKKMFKWHQMNSGLYDKSKARPSGLLRYESFIQFANFWLNPSASLASSSSSTSQQNPVPETTRNAGSSTSRSNSMSNLFSLNEKQRRQLIEMEYSIIKEELVQAFQVGLDSQALSLNEIYQLLRAVFKEYPLKFFGMRGNYLIIDYIDVLSSDRNDPSYKRLLSDVKCRTVNKQYAQWLLSIRSFALINMCWSVIKFYRKVTSNQQQASESAASRANPRSESGGLSARSRDAFWQQQDALKDFDVRMSNLALGHQETKRSRLDDTPRQGVKSSMSSRSSSSSSSSATSDEEDSSRENGFKSARSVRCRSAAEAHETHDQGFLSAKKRYDLYIEAVYKNDFPDVLHYLISTEKCDQYKKDDQNRTLVFLAVVQEKPRILRYLIKRWPLIDVNEASDNGNTALHAAVNTGNIELVQILLESLQDATSDADSDATRRKSFLDVNKKNEKCMSATPLHLAVWNDFVEIAILLLQHKADPYQKMNGLSTAFDLALENSNQVLHDLLHEYSSFKK